MKKLRFAILSFVVLLCTLFFGGCGKTVINCEADEIKLYSWEYSGEQGLVSRLEFKEDNAVLTIVSGDERCEINGLCVFGEGSFVIIDNSLKREFPFKYTLSGKELNIEYNGDSISFEKIREVSSEHQS
ncbi:MAG: hypothetical protein II931_02420 [Clostridia bacterium]|nr:hypothetical protein [Clostridia bacterium]